LILLFLIGLERSVFNVIGLKVTCFMFYSNYNVILFIKLTQTAESKECEVQALQFRRSNTDLDPNFF